MDPEIRPWHYGFQELNHHAQPLPGPTFLTKLQRGASPAPESGSGHTLSLPVGGQQGCEQFGGASQQAEACYLILRDVILKPTFPECLGKLQVL